MRNHLLGIGQRVTAITGSWRRHLALLVFALAFSGIALPTDTAPELEFRPSSVNLPGAAQQASALVVVRNPTDVILRNLRLSWLPRPGLDVQPTTPLFLSALSPHSDHVWTLTIKLAHAPVTPVAAGPSAMTRLAVPPVASAVSAPAFGLQAGQSDEHLDLRLEYETVAGGTASPQVVLKSLPIKRQDLGDLDKILDVQVKATLESLDSSQWGSIYVVLKNNSARTVNILNVAPVGRGVSFCQGGKITLPPSSLPFCFYSSVHALTLAPYQRAVEEFQVKANDGIKAGKCLVVFQIAIQSLEGGVPLRGNMLISQDVDVGVLGQPAVLTVAGIPVFFLVPGTLLLLTIGLCWSLEEQWWRAPDQEEFPFKLAGANFWLVSVIISLLIAIVPWLFRKRWYFSRYGLQDIALLWFASILAGIACYVVWWIYRNHRRLQAAERILLLADAQAARSRTRSRT